MTYNFIGYLTNEDVKEFCTLALTKLKDEKNIKNLNDAKSLPPHSMFGHRKLPINWKEKATVLETTTSIEGGIAVIRNIYHTTHNLPLTTEERTLAELLEGLKKGDFSFYFTFSEDFGVIFCSVVSTGSTGTTPYVLEEIKGDKVNAFSYFQDKYKKPDDDAIYRVIARIVTTDLLNEWTNTRPGSEKMFIEKALPGCNFERKTVLRFFNEKELE